MKLPQIVGRLRLRISDLCRDLFPHGKQILNEWRVGDITGAPGDSLAISLKPPKEGLWVDRANPDSHGDVLDLIAQAKGLHDRFAAADWGRSWLGLPAWQPGEDGAPPPKAWDPMESARWCFKGTEDWVTPTAAWPYRDAKGTLFLWVCRYNKPGGGKDVIPWRQTTEPMKSKSGKDIPVGTWRASGFKGDEKRPIYGLDRMARRPGAELVIVEGEKTADAAQALWQDKVVICWQGGCAQLRKVDWMPVKDWTGRIALWPDNDKPGREAMAFLRALNPERMQCVVVPKDWPDGWDLADPLPDGVTKATLDGMLELALRPAHVSGPAIREAAEAEHYIPLGTSDDGYVFLSKAEGYVLRFPAVGLTEMNIYRLCPESKWEGLGYFNKNGLNWKRIAKHLIDECRAVGAYNENRLRGRGVYMDDGRVVFHAGNCLYVDGVKTEFSALKSKFLYPQRPPIEGFDLANPLRAEQSAKLAEVIGKCSWARPRDGVLYLGSIWLSFMPGALTWRSHLFNEAESGSGKSYLLINALQPLLSSFCHFFMAPSSTEAGIRQALSIDSLGVILDEFDAEGPGAREQRQSVVGLSRQSSSDTGGAAVKGTISGHAQVFRLRSNFIFHGTANGLLMKSDASRISIVELLKTDDSFLHTTFKEIKAGLRETTKDQEWCARFAGRALSLVRQTLASVDVFVDAVGNVVRDSRAADQLGALLAGAWMVENDNPPTADQAAAIVEGLQFGELAPQDTDTDHLGCLNALLAYLVHCDEGTRQESIGELLRRAMASSDEASSETILGAQRVLIRWGIKTTGLGDRFAVASKHEILRKVFAGTPYADKWAIHLKRVAGSSVAPGAQRFGQVVSRATLLPWPIQ